jgi:hypothetical protein
MRNDKNIHSSHQDLPLHPMVFIGGFGSPWLPFLSNGKNIISTSHFYSFSHQVYLHKEGSEK